MEKLNRLYGEDIGFLSNDIAIDFTTCSEMTLYLAIYHLGGHLAKLMNGYRYIGSKRALAQQISYDKSYNEELNNYEYAIEYCVYQTKRFGVTFQEPSTKHVVKTDSYIAWYGKWDTYFRSLTDLEKSEHYQLAKIKEVSKHPSQEYDNSKQLVKQNNMY